MKLIYNNIYLIKLFNELILSIKLQSREGRKIYKEGYSLYLEKQDFNGAIKLFDQSLIYNPQHQLSQCMKGNALSKMGKYKESIVWYDQCIRDAIQRVIDKVQAIDLNVDSIFKKEALRQMGQYKESIEWFDKALAIDPKHVDSLFKKGEAIYYIGQKEKSIKLFYKALAIDLNVESLFKKGEALYYIGQKEKSIEWFNKALEIDPKHVDSLFGKGQSLHSIGKYQEAKNVLNLALKLDPDNLLIQNKLNFSKWM